VVFTGFPAEAFTFYERLEADNSKAFWQANKSTFDESVQAPMAALCGELGDYGPFRMFRPYNDLRFAKNRPPYKTHQGAYVEADGGSGYYFHIGADGLLVGVGYYGMAKDQLERFRDAVVSDETGPEVERITAALAKQGYSIGAMDELKSAPRGYPKDHPRIALLKRKGLMASRQFPVAKWMSSKQAAGRIRSAWDGARPLCDWLDANVGPSTMPPEDAFG
jgi:uncharacterized protein (TIGR02453 family)